MKATIRAAMEDGSMVARNGTESAMILENRSTGNIAMTLATVRRATAGLNYNT